MKYRIEYEKKDALAFISQLDVQKTFQRAFRRCDIKLAFSNGFNPHPKIQYSPPIPLFSTSYSEYMDVALIEDIKVEALKEKLNFALPINMQILSVEKIKEDDKGLSMVMEGAVYKIEISFDGDIEKLKEDIEKVMGKDEIFVDKVNKKGKVNRIDIKPRIKKLEVFTEEDSLFIEGNLSLVPGEILSPSLLIEALKENVDLEEEIKIIQITKIKTIITGK